MKMLAVAVMLLGASYGFSQVQKERKIERVEIGDMHKRVHAHHQGERADIDLKSRSNVHPKRVALPRHEAKLKEHQHQHKQEHRIRHDREMHQELKKS